MSNLNADIAALAAALRTERLRTIEQIRRELPVRPIGANHSLFDLDMLHTILDEVAGLSGEEPNDPAPPLCPVCEGWGAYCDKHKP